LNYALRFPKWALTNFKCRLPTALFTIGVAYGLGIVVALVVCTASSGGHFSPGVTAVHVIFNGFAPARAIR
jgi:glycerol uptake facilitator-like aquaporin